MKTFKIFLDDLSEAVNPSTNKPKKQVASDTLTKETKIKKINKEKKPGIIGSFVGGAVAAAHRHIMGTAYRYGYQPITDYMKSGSKKKSL